MRLIRALRRRLAREDGFTMATVMAGMLLVMAISVAAVAAAGGDLGLARYDQDDKTAYAAAEAGVNEYLGNLNSDANYWANCTNVSAPVSQRGAVTGASTNGRRWKRVPDSTNADYSIELIPGPGQTECKTNDPLQSMVKDGNVRVRSTGRVPVAGGRYVYRTVNATFRRSGFLDFLYYTKYENQDPKYFARAQWRPPCFIFNCQAYQSLKDLQTQPAAGNVPLKEWVATNCQRLWWGDVSTPGQGRGAASWSGQVRYNNTWYSDTLTTSDVSCGEIQFVSGDEVKGPFHSEDSILICGTPSFGSTSNTDRVEIVAPSYRTGSGCGTNNPTFRPRIDYRAASLEPPQTNAALKDLTLPGYSFTGQTTIELRNTGQMVVTNNGTTRTLSMPSNGVVYVGNNTGSPACGEGYDPNNAAAEPAGCGDVKLSGTYVKDLTIAAENDIIVTANTQRPANTKWLLGLIAGKFLRVSHPTCTNTPSNIKIDAAILTLDGSFTVDNYWCGGALGNLSVTGAIAQLHRGVVGTGSGTGMNGYIKDYNYDTQLKYRSPPHFLDPLQASWRILRQGEQSPPASQ